MKKAIIALISIAVIGIGSYAISNSLTNEQSSQVPATQQPVASDPTLTTSENGTVVSYEGQEGKTALEVLKSLADVKTEEAEFGEFVSGINDVEADPSKEYWAFYVDGEYASEGAGTYKTIDGESLQWRLEQL